MTLFNQYLSFRRTKTKIPCVEAPVQCAGHACGLDVRGLRTQYSDWLLALRSGFDSQHMQRFSLSRRLYPLSVLSTTYPIGVVLPFPSGKPVETRNSIYFSLVPNVKADNLPPPCADVKKSGSLNLLEPSGSVDAYNGTAFSAECNNCFPW
jgi:hypothetical protein